MYIRIPTSMISHHEVCHQPLAQRQGDGCILHLTILDSQFACEVQKSLIDALYGWAERMQCRLTEGIAHVTLFKLNVAQSR